MKKRAKVHLLPTDKESHIFKGGGTVQYIPGRLISNDDEGWRKNQHLYITTDDEIKEGDWGINNKGTLNKIETFTRFKWEYRKVIATTDPMLHYNIVEGITDGGRGRIFREKNVPQIPQSFIEEYCKVGGIDEVDVEYLVTKTFGDTKHLDTVEIKVNSNNEITIHLIEEKMYSREEVVQLLMKSLDATVTKHDKFRDLFETQLQEWIKENI